MLWWPMVEWNGQTFLTIVVVALWLLYIVRWCVSKRRPVANSCVVHIKRQIDPGDNVGVKSIQGARAYMEDVYQVRRNLSINCEDGAKSNVCLYAVFDGHGGARASKFAAANLPALLQAQSDLLSDPQHALVTAFEALDEQWLVEATQYDYDDGSTAIVALAVDHTLFIANLGDCRAVLASTKNKESTAVDLSHDHKPIRADEKERIEKLGGKILHFKTWRVQGILAVTRAFGDRKLKKYITATPEVSIRELGECDSFLILASDGVWDVLSSQDSVDLVHEQMVHSGGTSYCQESAVNVTDTAYRCGSMDNITTMVVDLRCHWPSHT